MCGSTYSTEKKKITDDDDDGTVRHHLSNLNGTNEQCIDRSINHGHRVNCCITYVLKNCMCFIYDYFAPSVYRYPAFWIDDGATKIKTGKSWSVFNLFTPKLDHILSKSPI